MIVLPPIEDEVFANIILEAGIHLWKRRVDREGKNGQKFEVADGVQLLTDQPADARLAIFVSLIQKRNPTGNRHAIMALAHQAGDRLQALASTTAPGGTK